MFFTPFQMSRLKKPIAAMVAGTAVLSLSACRFSGFSDTAAKTASTNATRWLLTQQQSDGSFEVAGFAGFETPDAIAAIAENSQQQFLWNTSQALTAVRSAKVGNVSALDWTDAWSQTNLSAGQAAKLIMLVVKPLGMSSTAFDPSHNGAPVDLKAKTNAGLLADGSFGTFNATLYAAIARRVTGQSTPAKTLAYIKAAQHTDGGWDYAGDPANTNPDIDTTALAIQALTAAKVAPADAALTAGLKYLATNMRSNGSFQSFGSDDPNSTSTAILAITAAGYDATQPCWRDRVAPALAGPYASPVAWIQTQANADGHISSPNDGFGLNTFATTQSIEALRRGWLPINPLDQPSC